MVETKPHVFHIPSLDEMARPQVMGPEMKLFNRQQNTSTFTQQEKTHHSQCKDIPSNTESQLNRKTVGNEVSTVHTSKGSDVTTTGTTTVSSSKVVLNSCSAATKTKSRLSNAIIVSLRQKGNPILKQVRNVPWEFGDIVPDYQMGKATCALFLSLRYHQLHPNYIHERLKQLGHSFDLRVLLTLVDVKDPHHALKELAKMCLLADCTLMLAFSVEEAGRLLETYKSFENKPPELIMEKCEGNRLSQVTDALTSVKTVNKTDAMTLVSTFRTFENIVQASQEEMSLCPGFGPQKAARLHRIFHEPFLRAKKAKKDTAATSGKDTGDAAITTSTASTSASKGMEHS